MWVRGLKLVIASKTAEEISSHPMWVRGLKHRDHHRLHRHRPVAPHVGAWIETY